MAKKTDKTDRPARNYGNVTLRLYSDEYQVLLDLCAALSTPESKVDKSKLFLLAAVEEATLLGFSPSSSVDSTAVRPKPGKWKYAVPEREDESYAHQLTITAHPLELRSVEHAAAWANVKLQRFFVGSLYRFAAKRKHAEPNNPKLSKIHIEERFFK